MKVEGTCVRHIVCAVRQIQHGGCESSIPAFLYLWVLFNVNDDGKDKELRFWFREIFQKREFRYFAVGKAVHPGIFAVSMIATITGEWFPCDRWRVVSI